MLYTTQIPNQTKEQSMAVTDFGRAVRKARQHTDETLMTMSKSLGVSVAFLSAIETGRNKIPMDFVQKVIDFFVQKDYHFDENLVQLANVSNGNIVIDKLDYQHQMMIAGFANSTYSKDELDKICELLSEIQKARQEAIDGK